MTTPDWVTIENGHASVGARTLDDIVASVGTPCYIYSAEAVLNRVAELRAAFPENVHLKYAVKANPYEPLVELLGAHIDAFDIASVRELEVAGSTGRPMSFSGPSKQYAELERAVSAGVTVNIESPSEVVRLLRIAEARGQKPRAAIRVNPGFSLASSGMRMTGSASQFGLDEENVQKLLADWPADLEFVGFHYFGGSQCLEAEILSKYYAEVVQDAVRLCNERLPLKSLNIGLSLGIPYNDREEALPVQSVSESLNEAVAALHRQHRDCQVEMETGRYLVGEAGLFVTRVIDVKTSREETFVVCDGGMNHHLAASGNFGQVIPRNYPAFFTPTREDIKRLQVVGPLCTPLDQLARNAEHGCPEEGDLFCVSQSGAYGASASPQGFLSRGRVFEHMI